MISNVSLPIQSVIYLTERGGFCADCTTAALGDKLAKCESGGYSLIAILETTDHDALCCSSMLFINALKETDPYSKLERKARFAEYMEELDGKGLGLTVACPDARYPLPKDWKKALSIRDLMHDLLPIGSLAGDYSEVMAEIGFSEEDIAHLKSIMEEGQPFPDGGLFGLLGLD